MILMMQVLLWGRAGDLDNTFGSDGIVTTDIGSVNDEAYSVAIQSDGKIVVAGKSGPTYAQADFTVVRYDTNGSLDSTFDGDGKVITDIGGSIDQAYGVAIQSDGKIVVAGHSYTSSGYYNFAVVRYDTNGSLDSTFGGDGKVTTSINYGDHAYSVAIQSNGKIVVAGYSQLGNQDFAVVRYDTNGSLDGTFSGDGKVTTPVGTSNDIAYSVAIQSDGKIVVAGKSESSGANDDFAVVRYDTDGNLDDTFDGNGKVTTDTGSNKDSAMSVAIQSDGKIIAVGIGSDSSNEDFAVVRYDTDGSPDSTFGSEGIVITDIDGGLDRALGVFIQNNRKIVVAGTGVHSSKYAFAVVRYDIDGSLDSTFGSEGKVTTHVGSVNDYAYSVAIQSDGKIVVAGRSYDSGHDFAVVRYIGDPVITLAPIYYLLQ